MPRRTTRGLPRCSANGEAPVTTPAGCPGWTAAPSPRTPSACLTDGHARPGADLGTRKSLHETLLEARTQEDVRAALQSSVTCVVTADQHAALEKGNGWERYAGITIVPGPKAPPGLKLPF